MAYGESVEFNRNCEVVQIPQGTRTMISKGSKGRIMQSLGGSYTLSMDDGSMVRITGEELDAIGKEKAVLPPKLEEKISGQESPLEEKVWNELKTCYDPEIPINIVDLGLVYECKVTPSPEGDGSADVNIKMTLTAPGCGMGEVLKRDAEQKIQRLPGVKGVQVDLVWEPAWDQSKMSDAAKLKLGLL